MYLIFDLDDTLLTSDKKITNFTSQTLKHFKNKGHIIIINSARSYQSSSIYEKDTYATYNIANGGSAIYKEGNLIYSNSIECKTCNEILKMFKDNNIIDFSFQTNECLFTNNKEYSNINNHTTYYDFNNSIDFDSNKIVFSCSDDTFAKNIARKFNLNLINYLNGTWYRLSKASKHTGNLDLYKILNDNNPKSISFGDDVGDIEMLVNSTYGVGMKNSVKQVLDNVKYITDFSNNEDGVAKYLLKLEKDGIL